MAEDSSIAERLVRLETLIKALPCGTHFNQMKEMRYEFFEQMKKDKKDLCLKIDDRTKEIKIKVEEISDFLYKDGLRDLVKQNTEFRERYEKRSDWWMYIIRAVVISVLTGFLGVIFWFLLNYNKIMDFIELINKAN